MSTKYPTIKDLSGLIKEIKPYIDDSYVAEDEALPGIDLTVGFDPDTSRWSYQTGDNSFSGGAYSYPIWAVTRIYRRSNSRELARELIEQLAEQTY